MVRTPYSLARVGFGYSFDIFVLGNMTRFTLTDLSLELLQSLVRTPYSLARVGFGYSFDIFVLDNPTGFIPNRLVLRVTPVLG